MTSSRGKNESAKPGRSAGRPQLQPLQPEPHVELSANGEMLRSIKVMIDEQRTEILAGLESMISGLVKREVSAALVPLEEKVSRHGGTISDLERSATEHGDQLTVIQANVATLTATVESLSKKCEELEVRSRWHNIRLVGLPEGTEGPQPTEFIANFLMQLLGLEEKPGLDRAHRTLRAKPREGEPPRPLVIRITLFRERNEILRRAGRSSPLLHQGKRVHIFPDFTPTVAKQRAAFIRVKRELHACADVKFGLRYPATLHITTANGQTHRFDNPDRALEFVQKNLQRSPTEPSD